MNRRWLLWIFTIAFVWVVITRFAQIQKLAQIIAEGQWNWVLAAAGLQLVYFILLTLLYKISFQTVNVQAGLWHLLPVTFSSFFLNLVAPAGGAAGNALFISDAARRGQSAARAAAGVLLMMVTDFIGFTILLVSGLVILFNRHDLKIYEIAASLFLIVMTTVLTVVLLVGLWHPALQRWLLFRLRAVANRVARWFRRPEVLGEQWAEETSEEFTAASLAIGARPSNLALGLGVSFISHVVNILCLDCLFRAFYQPALPSTLVAGYAIGILFWIVSITPQGVGVVEGLMALTFSSLGVPIEPATIIAIVYRGLNVWIPVVLGFILIHRTRTFRRAR